MVHERRTQRHVEDIGHAMQGANTDAGEETTMRILAKSLKRSSLIIPMLMAASVFAQGPGGFGDHWPNGGGTRGIPRTPPTAAQLAAHELTMVARFLKLDSALTSALTGDTGLVADLTTEQTTLQTNAASIRAAFKALATDVAAGKTADEAVQETTIETMNNLDLQAHVTAAGQLLSALPGLGINVSSTQAASLAQMLIGGRFGR
jgi:hypothetical protein